MARNLQPKCKLCRRAAAKLFLKGERCQLPKCALSRRNYPPGVHGVKGQPRLSNFGLRLREKQRVKQQYGLLERQFKNYYQAAKKVKGNTAKYLAQALELRLDNIIYRLQLAASRNQARQLVTHGHFLINNRAVNIPSSRLKVGDIIIVNPVVKKQNYWLNQQKKVTAKNSVPAWLAWDTAKSSAKILAVPDGKDLDLGINYQLIIEYYSK